MITDVPKLVLGYSAYVTDDIKTLLQNINRQVQEIFHFQGIATCIPSLFLDHKWDIRVVIVYSYYKNLFSIFLKTSLAYQTLNFAYFSAQMQFSYPVHSIVIFPSFQLLLPS